MSGATDPRNTTPQVFVSYSSTDAALARRIASDLRTAGLHVWLDQWDLRVGEEIDEAIGSGVDESEFMVVVLSEASVSSEWVQREWRAKQAQEGDRVGVLPVRSEPCETPDYLAGRPIVDVSGGAYEPGLRHLLELLEHHADGWRPHRQAPGGDDHRSEWAANLLNVVTPIAVEFSPELWPMFEGADRDDNELVNRWFPRIRTVIKEDLGAYVPGIRLRLNSRHTPPGTFRVSIDEATALIQDLDLDDVFVGAWPDDLRRLGIDPSALVDGIDVIEGMVRLDDSQRRQADAEGIETLASYQFAVLTAHRIIRRMAAAWLTIDVAELVLSELHPNGDDARVPEAVSAYEFTAVLRGLVSEGVPIIDMAAIVDTLARRDRSLRHVWQLVDAARAAIMSASPTSPFDTTEDEIEDRIDVLGLDPEIERLVEAVIAAGDGRSVTFEPDVGQGVLDAVGDAIRPYGSASFSPPILVRGQGRHWVRGLIAFDHPDATVLSVRELPPGLTPRVVDVIALTSEHRR